MSYEQACAVTKDRHWSPENYIDHYWYFKGGDVYYSDESDNPENWEDSYCCSRSRHIYRKDGYVLFTLEDGGGRFQALFSEEMEVNV